MNFDTLFSEYRAIIFEFILELYIFYILFIIMIPRLKKKKGFYIWFVCGFIVIAALGILAAAIYQMVGNTVIGRTAIYTVLFFLSVLHMYLCCKETIWSVLFCCVGAYASQNLAYKVFLIVWYLGESLNIFPGIFSVELGFIYYYLYYYVFLAIEVFAVYFIFIKKMQKYISIKPINNSILAFSTLILIFTILLCTIQDLNAIDQPLILRQVGNLFSIISCVCALLLLSGLLEKNNLKNEVQILQHSMQQKNEQYLVSKETIDLINIKCHDMRHKLNALRAESGNVSSKYFDELDEAISIYDANIQTGNKALDILLTEKSLYCEKRGIRFTSMVDGANLSFIEENDLYCLFGNIVENAIEAVSALPSEEQRTINLVVKTKGELLFIQAQNYFDGQLIFDEGLPMTSKSDTNYHGFGMKSIKMIVNKYRGEVTAFADNNIFHLNILFSNYKIQS